MCDCAMNMDIFLIIGGACFILGYLTGRLRIKHGNF